MRVCVVTRAEHDYVELVYGQGHAAPDGAHLEVVPGSRAGRDLGISKPTYFHATAVHFVHIARLRRKAGRCPQRLFLRLLEFAEVERARGYPGQAQDEGR